MSRKVMIACAITGAAESFRRNPAVPVTPKQIAESSIEAAKAGASIVHLHVRDPQTGAASMEVALYREVVERIRESGTDVILNLTTGAGGRYVPDDARPGIAGPGSMMATAEQRVEHVLALRPEICSLDLGTFNFGDRVLMNTAGQLRTMARAVRDAGVMPEIEVFDTGHLLLGKKMIEEGDIRGPGLFQLCLGLQWGQPATPEAMKFLRDLLPPGGHWFSFGISHWEMPMAAQSVILGGHVRVGLEDNLYLSRGVLAPSNAALVERAVRLVDLLGESVATPAEARKLLGLGGASKAD